MITYRLWILYLVITVLASACSTTTGFVKKNPDEQPSPEKKVDVAEKEPSHHGPDDDGAFHIVGSGETLHHICDVYGLDIARVAKINGFAPSHPLKQGDSIFLPAQALLADNDELQQNPARKQMHANGWGTPAAARPPSSAVVTNAIRGQRDPSVPELKFPVPNGVLTSPFGYRWGRFHKGLDIAAPLNTAVLACAEGKVVFTGSRKRFRRYGNTVLIAHGKGSYTYYAHLNQISVRRNQKIRKGQKIGLVGNTGRSTGPHLHLEVRVANNVYNPLGYFAASELTTTRLAKRFADSPMGPVRSPWRIPDLLTASH
jgi:murein DD-endopeptidase MepM/ murein hydrolase activator NlpD